MMTLFQGWEFDLRSFDLFDLGKKERRDRSDLFQYRIYLSITKNDRFDRKTDYQILKPALFFSSFALLSL